MPPLTPRPDFNSNGWDISAWITGTAGRENRCSTELLPCAIPGQSLRKRINNPIGLFLLTSYRGGGKLNDKDKQKEKRQGSKENPHTTGERKPEQQAKEQANSPEDNDTAGHGQGNTENKGLSATIDKSFRSPTEPANALIKRYLLHILLLRAPESPVIRGTRMIARLFIAATKDKIPTICSFFIIPCKKRSKVQQDRADSASLVMGELPELSCLLAGG